MTPLFIAEVSSNHHRDLARCLAFIDRAAEVGCDGVKFQLFRIDELFAPEVLAASETHRKRKDWELPVAFLPELAKRCREKNILFSCTPFSLNAVDELLPYVDFYKIASYELLWHDLIAACAATGKPVVLSTGMATMEEVVDAVQVLVDGACPRITVLHCVSGYPTPVAECNLASIATLERELVARFPKAFISCGWSDHTVSPAALYRAVHRWQAKMIEFHLDLDGTGEEYSAGHCWLPGEIGRVIETIRKGETADGDGRKLPATSERADRDWRADPADGLRPLKALRAGLHKKLG